MMHDALHHYLMHMFNCCHYHGHYSLCCLDVKTFNAGDKKFAEKEKVCNTSTVYFSYQSGKVCNGASIISLNPISYSHS